MLYLCTFYIVLLSNRIYFQIICIQFHRYMNLIYSSKEYHKEQKNAYEEKSLYTFNRK